MKRSIISLAILILLFVNNGFSQNASETFFKLGTSFLKSKDFNQYYDSKLSPPTFLSLGVSHSWYRTDKRLTFNKEIGIDFRYASPELSSGGLGAHTYTNLKLLNLYAECVIQAQFRIDSIVSIGFGPAVEYMVVGYNKEETSYYSMVTTPPSSGDYSHSGFNRNYFNDPLWGVKLSLYNFGISNKATFKLDLSYFWMKEDISTFHCTGLMKIGLAVAFHREKGTPEKG